MYDTRGQLQSELAPGVGSGGSRRPQQLIAYVAADTFWTSHATADGYAIELWSYRTGRIRTLRRTSEWFARHSRNGTPRVATLHADSLGRAIVVITAPGKAQAGDQASGEERDRANDVLIEVLDTRSASLLAQWTGNAEQGRNFLPRRILPGRTSAYRTLLNEDDLPAIEIVHYNLIRTKRGN